MIAVSAWIMLMATLRDRAALFMSFVLPPLLFLVFAAIFSGATGRDLKLKVGLRDLAHTESSQRFMTALKGEDAFRFIELDAGGEEALTDLVRRGMADVGVLVRGDLQRRPEAGPPPLLVIEDAARPLAAAIAIGQTQRTLNEKLPDVTLARILADVEAAGAIDRQDRDFLTDAFHKEATARKGSGFGFANILERRTAEADGGGRNGNVLYYAGAVTAVFMLFAAMHGALTLLDERRGGIAERLMIGRGGLAAVVAGKFLFLAAQGLVQAALVFLTAALVYHATFDLQRFAPWFLSCTLAAMTAAALALLAAALCRSRRQAENLTTFAVLLVSAMGGSMVPRYLMPPWLQDLGWLTPNAWIIQALDLAARPAASLGELGLAWGVLAAVTVLAGLGAAAIAMRGRAYSLAGP